MKQMQERIIAWAESQPDIRAVLVVGSRARRDHPPDAWADLDLMIFATDFDPYLSSDDWMEEFGTVWVWLPLETGTGDPERVVVFDGGQKVDFVFYPLAELQHMVDTQTLPGVYQPGYFTLVDKDGLAAGLPAPPFKPWAHENPSNTDFSFTVNNFWYGAVYVAKQIRRRNLWVVKFRDWTLKELLLRMLEWHARADHDGEYDTRHDGHYVWQWTDSATWHALQGVFGRFDAADSWQALLATMDLFRRLATETAALLGLDYPSSADENVTAYVRRLYAEDEVGK